MRHHEHEWVPTLGGNQLMCRGCDEKMPVQAMYRRDARDTEINAARTSAPAVDAARVLKLMAEFEDGEAITDEITVKMTERYGRPDRPNQYASRIKELRKAGLVVETDRKRATRTGRMATIWKLVR